MYSPRVLPVSEMAESQNYAVLEFFLTGSAAGTAHTLIAKQRAASARVWVMTGDASADMSLAVARALVQRPDGKQLDSTHQALAQGLATYMTNVPAAADGAFCHAFAIGGVSPSDMLMAELVVRSQSTAGANSAKVLANVTPVTVCSSVRLNVSNQFLQDDGTTAVVAGTNTLVIVGGEGSTPSSDYSTGANSIVFGAIASPDVLDTVVAGDILSLRLYLKC